MLGLEGRYYADPSIYAAEREKIFRSAWQLIGTALSLAAPGAYLTVDIVGTSIFVIRGRDGVLRGFHNVCSHRGSRLLEAGTGVCERIRCPYHDWQYSDRGQLLATPWFDEASPFELDSWPLRGVSVEVWRGLVFAAIAPDRGLLDQLGDLPADLKADPIETYTEMASDTFRAAINWKTYIDQFNEFYHVPPVHAPLGAIGLEHYTAEPGRGMMRMKAPAGGAHYGGRWFWAWPNWTVSIFPGGAKTSRVNPLAADLVEVEFRYLFADASDAAAATRLRVIEATSSIFAEDVRACARVQANYASGASRPGPLHPRHERAVGYFQDLVREALAAV